MPCIWPKTNICITCQKACGDCSWSEVDLETGKIRFEPVPGWKAKKVLLNLGGTRKEKMVVETYHITYCPEYIPVVERKVLEHD